MLNFSIKTLPCLIISFFFILPNILYPQNNYSLQDKIDSLIHTSKVLIKNEQNKEAILHLLNAESAAKLKENKFGSNLAIIYFLLGSAKFDIFEYDSAVSYYNLALKYSKRHHIDSIFSKVQYNLGFSYYRLEQFKQSESHFEEYLSSTKKIYSSNHYKYKKALSNVSFFYIVMGYNEQALLMLNESIVFFQNQSDTLNSEYVNTLNNFGLSYMNLNNYDIAEQIFKRALFIMDSQKVNIESKRNLGLKTNLGITLAYQSKYSESLYYLNLAKSIFHDSINNIQHPFYLQLLSGLIKVYKNLGNYEKAIIYMQEKKNIFLNKKSNNSIEYGLFLLDFCRLSILIKKYQGIDSLVRNAIAIFESELGQYHSYTIKAKLTLANLYYTQNDYSNSLMILNNLEETLNNSSKGKDENYANVLAKKADSYYQMHQLDLSEQYFMKAKVKFEELNLVDKLGYSATLLQLCKLHLLKNNHSTAIQLASVFININHHLIQNSTQVFTEEELQLFLHTFNESIDLIHYTSSISNNSNSIENSLNQSLFYKSYVLNHQLRYTNIIHNNPSLSTSYTQLNNYKDRLTKIESYKNTDSSLVKFLKIKIDSLEYITQQASFSLLKTNQSYHWKELQSKINSNELIIEFVTYNIKTINNIDSIRYSAIIVRKDYKFPIFIDLCSEAQLIKINADGLNNKFENIHRLYSLDLKNKNDNLYTLLWQKIEKYLIGIKTIHFSPIGILHCLNLKNIEINKSAYVRDQFEIILHQNNSELLYNSTIDNLNPELEIVLFGGIDYNVKPSENIFNPLETIYTQEITNRANKTDSILTNNTNSVIFKTLKGSIKEIEKINSLIKPLSTKIEIYSQDKASKNEFKKLSKSANRKYSPRIIHISTHSHFTNDEKIIETKSSYYMKQIGLVLAGANAYFSHQNNLISDGIISAYEISLMDLQNTELVILSACNTGLGSIDGSEGVYGLQRAFRIAGAKNIMVSLWQIPDQQTALLMQEFYKFWLIKKMSVREALHLAQKTLQDKNYEPYYWAGFVLIE